MGAASSAGRAVSASRLIEAAANAVIGVEDHA
jgi:hypothetical protein